MLASLPYKHGIKDEVYGILLPLNQVKWFINSVKPRIDLTRCYHNLLAEGSVDDLFYTKSQAPFPLYISMNKQGNECLILITPLDYEGDKELLEIAKILGYIPRQQEEITKT